MQAKTRAHEKQTLARITANEVGKELNISRALASQYLNELAKEGVILKINSSASVFFGPQVPGRSQCVRLSSEPYLSMAELEQELAKGVKSKRDFEKMIGSGSGTQL